MDSSIRDLVDSRIRVEVALLLAERLGIVALSPGIVALSLVGERDGEREGWCLVDSSIRVEVALLLAYAVRAGRWIAETSAKRGLRGRVGASERA